MNRSKFAGLLILLIFLTSTYCSSQKGRQPNMIKNDHKEYRTEWQKIDSLEQQGLPQSALEAVEALYTKVKKEGDSAQEIKCLLYRSKYQSQLEEDGLVKAIFRMQEEKENASSSTKPLLESMLAEFYSRYLDNNFWKLKDRTTTEDFKPDDIRTWTVRQLIDESNQLYWASVKDDGLRNVDIKDYDAITHVGQLNEGLRPSLYDFLAQRAITHFMNERNYLTEPAYKFYIDQVEAFADASAFTKFNFGSKDQESNQLNTLSLFQNLLKVHLNDESPRALVVADLQRLKYVYDKSIREDKKERYLQALERLSKKYSQHQIAAEINYELAQYHYQNGQSYQPGPKAEGQMDWKTAHDICINTIEKYPDTYGAQNCKSLQLQIEQKNLRLQTELVNLPNEAILGLVNYRNVQKVYLKTIKITEDQQQDIQNLDYRKHAKYFKGLTAQQNWNVDLPQVGDYRNHNVEIKIPALPLGLHLIIIADNPEFTDEKHALGYMITHVSELAYWSRNVEEAVEFIVTDRKSGTPQANVKAEFYQQNYNSRNRRYDLAKIGETKTDKDGRIVYTASKRSQLKIRLIKGNDQLYIGDNHYVPSKRQKREYDQMTFFLDRAIYRPGQQVFFKGIGIHFDLEKMPSIITNREVIVTFYDVNNQKVESLKLKTNAYGTVSGSFTAPQGALLGQMSLESSFGGNRVYFRVEEYKRPKFEVTLSAPEGSYKLGDKVTAKGQAKAFAGNVIDGAKVQYRVVREVSFPYWPWYYWSRGFSPTNNSMEITNGTTTTDAEGRFEIEFEAIPDKSVSAEDKPQFNYRVYADVVDITGETRSANNSVAVGYIALLADVVVAGQINRDSLRSLALTTTNLNGQFEAATGSLTITALKTPDRTFRSRYWPKPDMHIMDRTTFYKDFPYDAFKDDDLMHTWPTANQVLQTSFDTKAAKEITLDGSNWAPGMYVVELKTQDKYGQAIERKKYFTLYDLDNSKAPGNLIQFYVQEKQSFQPEETATYYIGSAEPTIKVLYEIHQDNQIIEREWLTVEGLQELKTRILEKHRGNFHYSLSFNKNNRSYFLQHTLHVPWSNKELKVEYATFREKLYPGQEEEWRIKISGHKSDKVAAEMLVTMYDASLDQFAVNNWGLSPYPYDYSQLRLRSSNFRQQQSQLMAHDWQPSYNGAYRNFRTLNWFNFQFYSQHVRMRGSRDGETNYYVDGVQVQSRTNAAPMAEMEMAEDAVVMSKEDVKNLPTKDVSALASKTAGLRISDEGDEMAGGGQQQDDDFDDIQVRTNLNETVFFMPDLMTDAEGNVIIKFTMNEALTRWKFMGLAHTKALEIGLTSKEIITQKDLMVMPNAPRFLRESDEIEYTAKVSNLTKEAMSGEARLQLFDALTNEPIDNLLGNTKATIPFKAEAGQSARLAWNLKIPVGKVNAVTHRVVAKAGTFSDGEESSLPVLTNRMMVTESLPLAVRGGQEKNFTFKSLKAAGESSTLSHHKLTLEFTSNPAWYAVQALPYLMEYPYECTEQIFSRYYANSLASSVANAHPRIKDIFTQWKDSDALLSNLSKNQELKSLLLEETPWVLQSQKEEEQKKNIGLLFDLTRMSAEQSKALKTISERQLSNGGFSWFPGGRDNWYISQYIVEGMGHLDQLGANNWPRDESLGTMVRNAVRYIDDRIVEHYEKLEKQVKRSKGNMEDDHLDQMAIHYLYTRSFFAGIPVNDKTQKVTDYYLGQSEKYWNNKSLYMEAMIGLALHRNKRPSKVTSITKSLKERALQSDEMGRYWKYDRGYSWYELPIETHALMIELFEEAAEDAQMVDDLKVWLLKNKQTKHWKTTKATAAAVYALLRRGDNWLLEDQPIEIALGGKVLDQSTFDKEPGTGYFKTSWDGEALNAGMGDIRVNNPNKVVAWGAMYWQYFEQLDKIKTFEETPLTIRKQLFREEASPTGPVMKPIGEGTQLQPGDKLKVRIELRVDRGMEYVHMKDMRASGLEPMNVLSHYKWQGGLGYYESTRDAATNFFFSYLPPGTHVFEYPLRVNHKGDFSNGITSVQCMYAPEFSSHSEGIRLKVE